MYDSVRFYRYSPSCFELYFATTGKVFFVTHGKAFHTEHIYGSPTKFERLSEEEQHAAYILILQYGDVSPV
jgi:hypothetical protein